MRHGVYLVTCLTTATATALMLAAVARNQTGMVFRHGTRTVALSAAGLICCCFLRGIAGAAEEL